MINLAEEVIEAHGGLARWQATQSVSLRLWAGGLAFRTKGHTRTLHDVAATVAIGHPSVSLAGRHPEPWKYRSGERPGRSSAWRGRWSLDQVAEFTAGALWTYVNAPLLAFLDGVTVEAPHPQRHHETRALRLTLPPGLGVHGPNHTLLIDDHGLIQSHHYVATAFGQWALAAQSVDDTQSFDGLLIGTRRRVTPRLSPTRGTPGPILVSIRLHPLPAPD
jgi:hypothetical protein